MVLNTKYKTASINNGSRKDHKKPKAEFLYLSLTSLKASKVINDLRFHTSLKKLSSIKLRHLFCYYIVIRFTKNCFIHEIYVCEKLLQKIHQFHFLEFLKVQTFYSHPYVLLLIGFCTC